MAGHVLKRESLSELTHLGDQKEREREITRWPVGQSAVRRQTLSYKEKGNGRGTRRQTLVQFTHSSS